MKEHMSQEYASIAQGMFGSNKTHEELDTKYCKSGFVCFICALVKV